MFKKFYTYLYLGVEMKDEKNTGESKNSAVVNTATNANKNFGTKNAYSFIDAFKCFLFLIIVTAGVSVILQIIMAIVASSTGKAIEEVSNSDTFTILTYVLSPLVFIIYFFVFNAIKKVDNKYALSDGQKVSLLPISISMVLAVICIFLFTPFMNLIDYFFSRFGYVPDNAIPLSEKMASGGGYFWLGVLIFCLLPAIAEELIFRGIIQKSLSTKLNGVATIILTTIMFTLMHGALQQTVYQLLVGIMLSYLVCVGGSIIYSIILHFLNNFFVLLFSTFDIVGYLSGENTIYYNIFSKIFPFLLFLLGLVLVAILFWVLKYLRNKNFFRYDPKKNKKVKKTEPVILNEPDKLRLKDLWGNTTYFEKIFIISSFLLVGIIWIINTISGFIA